MAVGGAAWGGEREGARCAPGRGTRSHCLSLATPAPPPDCPPESARRLNSVM